MGGEEKGGEEEEEKAWLGKSPALPLSGARQGWGELNRKTDKA